MNRCEMERCVWHDNSVESMAYCLFLDNMKNYLRDPENPNYIMMNDAIGSFNQCLKYHNKHYPCAACNAQTYDLYSILLDDFAIVNLPQYIGHNNSKLITLLNRAKFSEWGAGKI